MKTITKNLFRVLFITMISMSLMVTTGCEEDDVVEDEMVGAWALHEIEVGGETVSIAEAGFSITVVFTTSTYTSTYIDHEGSDTDTGTWSRTNSTTVLITDENSDNHTLNKEGAYYVLDEDDMKLTFKKLVYGN